MQKFFSIATANSTIDLGCGHGRVAKYCHEKYGISVLGCDISENMLDIANCNNIYPQNVSFVLCDMQCITSSILFDMAIASFSFIHLTEKQVENTLSNLRNLLIDNGLLYISVLVGDGCSYLKEPLDPSRETFVQLFTPNSISNILEFAGYKVIDIQYGEDDGEAALSTAAMFIFARKEQNNEIS